MGKLPKYVPLATLFEAPKVWLSNIKAVWKSLELYKNLSEEIGCDIEYENVGSLLCSVNDRQYPDMEKQHDLKDEVGKRG